MFTMLVFQDNPKFIPEAEQLIMTNNEYDFKTVNRTHLCRGLFSKNYFKRKDRRQ